MRLSKQTSNADSFGLGCSSISRSGRKPSTDSSESGAEIQSGTGELLDRESAKIKQTFRVGILNYVLTLCLYKNGNAKCKMQETGYVLHTLSVGSARLFYIFWK